jgi:hypothetical protein
MKRNSKANRPFARTRRSVRNTAGSDATTSASSLAFAAGGATRPTVEQLEARQMLFSLSITNENIAPGIGQVSAQFGYVLPYLAPTSAPQAPTAPEVTLEDFNDEVQPGPIPPAGVFVPNGAIFGESNLVVRHSIPSQTNARLMPKDPQGQDGYLFFRMQQGEQFSFQASTVAGQAGPFTGMSTVSMVFTPDGISYLLDDLRVSFLYDGNTLASFEGAALSAFSANPPQTGLNGQFDFTLASGDSFDEIVFESIGGNTNPGFFLDDVSYAVPSRPFEQIVEERIFGVQVTLAGPVGATAQFLDINGNDLINTLGLGTPANSELLLVDRNGDGIPDFNDGFGSIILNNTDANTSLTVYGGTIALVNNAFTFTLVQDLNGLFDDFESAGFGYEAVIDPAGTSWNVAGLPPRGGSVILGAPFVRDINNYNPGGVASNTLDFNRADQGIFVLGGGSMGAINIHGVVHGSSRFEGAVDNISIGYLVGSIAVQGDLGTLTVGTDAGLWVPELNPAQRNKTGGQLIVDRTAGQILVGGRSLMDVTVVGAINTPGASPARDAFRYVENEFLYAINPTAGVPAVITATQNNTWGHALSNQLSQTAQPFSRTSQGVFLGSEYLRNDTLMTAEWVGSIASGVQISGEIGFFDPLQAEDPADVYAFAVSGLQPIVVEIASFIDTVNIRLLDASGRTVASSANGDFRIGPSGNLEGLLSYTPSSAGVYNLVIQASTGADANFASGTPYVVTIGGLAPNTLGMYRTAASMGDTDGDDVTVTVLAGSIGSIRVGTGFLAAGGAAGTPSEIFNPVAANEDDQSTFYSGSFSTPSHVHQILTGGDIGGSTSLSVVAFDIGGRLDQLLTGQNPAIGLAFAQGDVANLFLTVGETIGELDVRGAIGADQDPNPDVLLIPSTVVVTTGTTGVPGHIGTIRVGSYVAGDAFIVNTSPDSIIGSFLVNQDNQVAPGTALQGIRGGDFGAIFSLGSGSDIRFVDFPTIDLEAGVNISIPIIAGQAIDLTDDAGGRVRVEVRGVSTQNFGIQLGEIRVLPVDQSQGVAIARIDVNLTLGAAGGAQAEQYDLVVTSLGAAGAQETISIGHINILSAGGQSSIDITGTGEVDVWKITMPNNAGGGGATGLLSVANRTPGGDIVAIDLPGLQDLLIERGNLGRTQTPGVGPALVGPFLGIGGGGGGAVGGGETPIALANALLTNWDGSLYRATNNSTFALTGSLDDVGSPINPFLNGLLVRGGDISTVRVSGEVGDVLATAGSIGLVVANSDGLSTATQFHGISGVIFASVDVVRVEVGDGLAQRAQSPISTSGIFAGDDIHQISATQVGAFLSGSIGAANAIAADRAILEFVRDGIEAIEVVDGNILLANIAAMNLDQFWFSAGVTEVDTFLGDIGLITGTNASIIRSAVIARAIDQMIFTNGVYDASSTTARNDLGEIRADQFLNSTITGSDREFRTNEIIVGGNLGTLTTNLQAGDVSDLRVDVLGSITAGISARNFSRLDLDTDITIFQFSAVNDVRGSSITGGELRNMNVARNIRASEIAISGPIENITADSILDTSIAVTGPDGQINTIRVRGLLRGEISASGPIDLIQSTEDDIRAFVTTTTDRGNIRRLEAFRDLDITTDVSGTVEELVAGRHIGNRDKRGIILVRGNLDSVDVSGGQLYADLRVGQEITGEIKIGSVDNTPGAELLGAGSIIAFDRINQITVEGDFDGDIISHSGGIGNVTINNGSFLAGNTISAFAGSIGSVVINAGHLLGNIHADHVLNLVQINASADGVFGDIGINPALSAATAATGTRNQLPPGVATTSRVDGPRITADQSIGRIILTNGSIFEAFIYAKQALGVVNVNGSIQNDPNTIGQGTTTIAAGDLIFDVRANFNIFNTNIAAGIIDFGADGRLGGTGADADTVKTGRVRNVSAGNNAINLFVSSGVTAGDDGIYNSADDKHALGFSWIRQVTIGGAATNVSAHADSGLTTTSTGSGTVAIGGRNTAVEGGVLESVQIPRDTNGVPMFDQLGQVLTQGATFNFTSGTQTGTITYSGPGTVVWNQAQRRLMLLNTTLATTVTVTSNDGFLSNFNVVSNDDASVGTLAINPGLFGQSTVTIDGYVRNLTIGGINDKTAVAVGNDIQNLTLGSFKGGSLSAIFVRNVSITGDVGGTLNIFGSRGVSIDGKFTGVVSMARSLRGDFAVGGAIEGAAFRSGGSVGNVSASSISESFISALEGIGNVDVVGSVFDTSIMAGADLGRDATPGGTGINADRTAAASLGNVTVGGNFFESDALSGVLRGPDGFFGTSDDAIAPGRSTIGNVTINGTGTGSNLGSESFRVATTGTMGPVTVGGAPVTSTGNFAAELISTQPLPIQVESLKIIEESRIYTAQIVFNQPIDSSTIGTALSVSEVRGSGEIKIRLIEGQDYTITYDAAENSALIEFAPNVTQRSLPQVPGEPGPGIYRFAFDADLLRAQLRGARVDGDSDGFAEANDDYSSDDIVGDAGDKLVSNTVVVTNPLTNIPQTIDFYKPIDLDIVLDGNRVPDSLVDTNTPFTLRGSIGDHPDHSATNFRFSGDVDVYTLTLQSGQILQLGNVTGAANSVLVQVVTPGSAMIDLPAQPLADGEIGTLGQNLLITETGQYTIVVSTPDNADAYLTPGDVRNTGPIAGGVGGYAFTIEVFDDGDSGFSANTDAGDGTPIQDAPPSDAFAGVDGILGTADDLETVFIGLFEFTLEAGDDGTIGTADDRVVGTDGLGVTSSRIGNVLSATIDSAIGDQFQAGVPDTVAPDVDVYHLNAGETINPGSRIRVTVRLSDLGSNLGGRISLPGGIAAPDFTGLVQFGVFETTNSTSLSDALLVVSPSDFAPIGGQPGVIANDGNTSYGFDSLGDFFIEFLAPGSQFSADPANPDPASYAIYLQGVYNTDYQIEVVQSGASAIQRSSQNVLIETRGGLIDWLETSGTATNLQAFSTSVLGFTGKINGMTVDDFVLSSIITDLNLLFAASGVDVQFSTNPSQFEFQDFSTVFLTNSVNPINFFTDRIYGVAEHADALNADRNDEAAIFIPSMSTLGYTPSVQDIEDFTDSLTSAVGRRVGELLGLRMTQDGGASVLVDPQSANSVENLPILNGTYQFSTLDRALSGRFDSIGNTDFFLGRMNSQSLLDAVLLNR